MARSRKYGWNGELPAKELSGQARIVFNGIKNAGAETMKTGKDWTEDIGKELKTRQDPYRVVLYYILILKALGVIKTEEFDITAVTKNADDGAKHPVTVKSTAVVETGAPILDHVDQDTAAGDDTDADATDDELETVEGMLDSALDPVE